MHAGITAYALDLETVGVIVSARDHPNALNIVSINELV